MILNTKLFKEAADTILLAIGVDKTVTNLELVAGNGALFLNVTNSEYYASVKFAIESTDTFRAVIDANVFLNLISGISADTFELIIEETKVIVKSNKSRYSIPLIFKNDKLMELPIIRVSNPTVEMPISYDILQSILNVNSKEVAKVKKLDVDELQRLYFIDESGCFTFTSGACINSFTLAKPVKMLLNDRIVKLFKLFNSNVNFKLGHEASPSGRTITKIEMTTDNVYVAAIISSDDILIDKMKAPYEASKKYLTLNYPYQVVISATEMSAAISRLMLFTKNSVDSANMLWIPISMSVLNNEITLKDSFGNTEVFNTEDSTTVNEAYEAPINLPDLKAVVDSCKNEHLTISFGNFRNFVLTRGSITNLIPERRTS